MKIKILPDGIDDLYRGRLFYERINKGIGDYFFDSVVSDIDSLLLYAGIHPIVFGFHRMLAKRFPFAIYYKMDTDTVVIYRILDLRQDPESIKKNLSDKEQR